MSAVAPPGKQVVYYPDSDGQPMADNTVQYRWIATLKWNAEGYFRDDPNVFVAGDHLIYPVQGDPKTRQAPDVYVAFGRPKGGRGSYKVWEEGGIFPQVVFEVWSPNDRYARLQTKFEFYEKYGVEEYYLIYPEFPAHAEAWRRDGGKLVEIPDLNGWVSPRLGWQFHLDTGELTVIGPDGRLLRNPTEIIAERDAAEFQRAEAERQRAEAERQRAEAERQRAEADRQRAEADRQRITEQQRAAKLAAKLRELGVDPDAV